MPYISARDFVKRKRNEPLRAPLFQIACALADGNDVKEAGVLRVVDLRAKLPRSKLLKK